MKKIVAIFFVLCLITAAAFADKSGQCGDSVTWTMDSNGKLIISGSGDMWDYTYEAPPVWFEDVTSVTIQSGVTSIGEWAFGYCSSLSSVSIPSTVNYIGSWAFDECYCLERIILPYNITEINRGTFYGCSSLSSVTVRAKVENIATMAFTFCYSLNRIKLPENCNIEDDAFPEYTEIIYGESGQTSTEQPTSGKCGNSVNWSIDSAGKLTISGSGNMWDYTYDDPPVWSQDVTSLTVQSGVTGIGEWAFAYCSNLRSVSIADSVSYIGTWAFDECTSLTSITLPSSLTEIERGTFYRCTNLSSVSVPNNLTHIYEMAFLFCDSLNTIQIPGCTIEQDAFSPETVIIMTGIVPDFTLPEGLTTIDSEAFAGTSAHTIRIPAGVNLITLDAIPKTAMIITPKDAEIAQWFKENGYTVVYEGD